MYFQDVWINLLPGISDTRLGKLQIYLAQVKPISALASLHLDSECFRELGIMKNTFRKTRTQGFYTIMMISIWKGLHKSMPFAYMP